MLKKRVIVKSKLKAKIKSKKPILKTGDLPATQSMLTTVHKQIKAQINSTEKKIDARFNLVDARFNEMESRFSKIDARFNEMESRFSKIDARFNEIDARFNKLESKMDLILSEMHRMTVLMEEQNSRNKFVLDGYASLYERQDRLELRFDAHEKSIENLILKSREHKEN